jgi:hypothetical protein
MTSKPVLEVLFGPDAVIFLAELASRVTMMARSAYRGVDEPDVAKLRAANETLHAIAGKLIAASRGVEVYPDEAFLQSIRETAGEDFRDELEWAIQDALDTVRSRAPKAT